MQIKDKLFGSNGQKITLFVTVEQVFRTKTYHEDFESAENYIKGMKSQGMGMMSQPIQINVPKQSLVHMFNTTAC